MEDGIFSSGILELPVALPDAAVAGFLWSDSLVNRSLCIVALFCFLMLFMDWIRLVPAFFSCLSRSRASLGLEHSFSMARSRNRIALLSLLIISLVSDRFGLYAPSFYDKLSPNLTAPVTIAVLCGFLFLRYLLHVLASPKKLSSEQELAARRLLYTLSTVLALLMMLTVTICVAVGVGEDVVRLVLLVETALVFLTSMLRTGQIFALHCSGLVTFLYLCGLEILPAGILVFTSFL